MISKSAMKSSGIPAWIQPLEAALAEVPGGVKFKPEPTGGASTIIITSRTVNPMQPCARETSSNQAAR